MQHLIQRVREEWEGRAVLVTGATSGIGRAAALVLAQAGLKVFGVGRREARLAELQEEIRGQGGVFAYAAMDLAAADAVDAAWASAEAAVGPVDLLLNNAGIGADTGLVDASAESVEHCLDLNVKAALQLMRIASGAMAARPRGLILNLGSMSGWRTVPGRGSAAYNASKHALRAATETLRSELAARGSATRVCLVSPGFVDTEFHRDPTDPAKAPEFPCEPLVAEDVVEAILFVLGARPGCTVCDVQLRPTGQVT